MENGAGEPASPILEDTCRLRNIASLHAGAGPKAVWRGRRGGAGGLPTGSPQGGPGQYFLARSLLYDYCSTVGSGEATL
jgi:hypothetical protein